jgi:hypothetical protein
MRILNFKAKVEAELEMEKWERVARMTEEDGGKVMAAKEVRLRFKEIERNGFQVRSSNPENNLPDVTEADMDPIDRELAGVGEVDGASGLSDVERSYLDESMSLEQDICTEDAHTQEPIRGKQKVD